MLIAQTTDAIVWACIHCFTFSNGQSLCDFFGNYLNNTGIVPAIGSYEYTYKIGLGMDIFYDGTLNFSWWCIPIDRPF